MLQLALNACAIAAGLFLVYEQQSTNSHCGCMLFVCCCPCRHWYLSTSIGICPGQSNLSMEVHGRACPDGHNTNSKPGQTLFSTSLHTSSPAHILTCLFWLQLLAVAARTPAHAATPAGLLPGCGAAASCGSCCSKRPHPWRSSPWGMPPCPPPRAQHPPTMPAPVAHKTAPRAT